MLYAYVVCQTADYLCSCERPILQDRGPHSSRDCCYCSRRYVGSAEIGEIQAYERQDLHRIKICSVLVKLTATEPWLVQRLGYVKVLTSPSDMEL